jgi:hypothetical protein
MSKLITCELTQDPSAIALTPKNLRAALGLMNWSANRLAFHLSMPAEPIHCFADGVADALSGAERALIVLALSQVLAFSTKCEPTVTVGFPGFCQLWDPLDGEAVHPAALGLGRRS